MALNNSNIIWKDYEKLYAQNEHPPSTLFHKHISKRLAKLLTFIFLRLNCSPNFLSLSSFFLVILGIISILIFGDDLLGSFLFLICTQLSYAIDCSDGVVARINQKTSSFGGFLDLTLDRLSSSFLMIGTLYYLLANDYSLFEVFSCMVGFMAYQFYSYMSDMRGFIYQNLKGYTKNIKSRSLKKTIIFFIYEFIDTGTFYFLLFFGFFLKAIPIVLFIYFLLSSLLILANYYLLFFLPDEK